MVSFFRYLRKKNLCHRRVQTFIMKDNEYDVVQICNGLGWRVHGNLCISGSAFEVYDLNVNTFSCRVYSIVRGSTYVIVACDRVGNRCLPVHFEKYMNQRPTAELCHG